MSRHRSSGSADSATRVRSPRCLVCQAYEASGVLPSWELEMKKPRSVAGLFLRCPAVTAKHGAIKTELFHMDNSFIRRVNLRRQIMSLIKFSPSHLHSRFGAKATTSHHSLGLHKNSQKDENQIVYHLQLTPLSPHHLPSPY